MTWIALSAEVSREFANVTGDTWCAYAVSIAAIHDIRKIKSRERYQQIKTLPHVMDAMREAKRRYCSKPENREKIRAYKRAYALEYRRRPDVKERHSRIERERFAERYREDKEFRERHLSTKSARFRDRYRSDTEFRVSVLKRKRDMESERLKDPVEREKKNARMRAYRLKKKLQEQGK